MAGIWLIYTKLQNNLTLLIQTEKMLNLVLFGPPGAGKGTQSDKIIKTYDLEHLSTGEILRAEIATESELGQIAKSFIDKGELVSDEIVINMVKSKITTEKNETGYIFDGFPRTVKQAEELDKILAGVNAQISGIIALDVDQQELEKRLATRSKVSGRSDDTNMSIIRNRLDIYNRTTLPVLDFYKKQGKLQLIDGMGTIEEIFLRIKSAIEKVK